MQITDKRAKLIRISDIDAGETFLHEGSVYLAIDDADAYKAVKLDNGEVLVFDSDIPVAIVNCELIIKQDSINNCIMLPRLTNEEN